MPPLGGGPISDPYRGGGGREVLEGGRGGEGVWDPKACVPKWPDTISPIAHFVFPHFGLEGGGGSRGGG